jgi:uncharacterized protein (UPF0218 family)
MIKEAGWKDSVTAEAESIEERIEHSRQLLYNPDDRFYYTGNLHTAHSVEVADIKNNQEMIEHYLLGKYEKIFPKFSRKNGDYVSVAEIGNNITYLVHYKQDKTKKPAHIPGDIYRISEVMGYGLVLNTVGDITTDKYVDMSNNVDKLTKDVELFFSRDILYDQLKMVFKRGCLVYGPPGNGKTFQIIQAAKKVIKNDNCIVMTIAPRDVWSLSALNQIRDAISHRNKILVIEEISEWTKRGYGMEDLLSFLDGEYSWEKCYTIATTNYPEELPENIVDRPGRFDLLIDVPCPDEADRQLYISSFLGEVDEKIIKATEGFSISYLKELIIRSKFKEQPLLDTIHELEVTREAVRNKFRDKK